MHNYHYRGLFQLLSKDKLEPIEPNNPSTEINIRGQSAELLTPEQVQEMFRLEAQRLVRDRIRDSIVFKRKFHGRQWVIEITKLYMQADETHLTISGRPAYVGVVVGKGDRPDKPYWTVKRSS